MIKFKINFVHLLYCSGEIPTSYHSILLANSVDCRSHIELLTELYDINMEDLRTDFLVFTYVIKKQIPKR